MKRRKSGHSINIYLVILSIIGVFSIFIMSLLNKFVIGNRQIVDFNRNFNVAYVMGDSNKFERIRIKAWWENSDAVQVIKEDGTPVYTHLCNVKLAKEP